MGRRSGEAPSYGRLATSTDVLKGVIWRILQHPDGFSGEVVVAENTQWAEAELGQQPRRTPRTRTSPTRTWSRAFQARGYPVSFAAWDGLPLVAGGSVGAAGYPTGEYADGNDVRRLHPARRSGGSGSEPVLVPQVPDDRRPLVSMRYGLWNGASYEPGRVKLVNLPVLKKHGMAGSTIAWKNYIGFVTIEGNDSRFGSWDAMHDFFWGYTGVSAPSYGLIGPPDGPRPHFRPQRRRRDLGRDGRATPAATAVRQDALLASTDPFAVDWYTSEYVLRPVVPDGARRLVRGPEPASSAGRRASTRPPRRRPGRAAYPYIQMFDSCDTAVACAAEKNQMNAYVSTAVLPPTLSISNAAVSEGNTGTASAEFTVTLSAPGHRHGQRGLGDC